MKKLLLLASILAVSGVTFSAESAGSKAEKTGKLNVSVNIVQNLEMKTKDLDFGFLVLENLKLYNQILQMLEKLLYQVLKEHMSKYLFKILIILLRENLIIILF